MAVFAVTRSTRTSSMVRLESMVLGFLDAALLVERSSMRWTW